MEEGWHHEALQLQKRIAKKEIKWQDEELEGLYMCKGIQRPQEMESGDNLFLHNFDSTRFLPSKATRMAEGPEQA